MAESGMLEASTQILVQALAVDIALAALLGANVYGFGELLLHPIVSPAGTLQACDKQPQGTPSACRMLHQYLHIDFHAVSGMQRQQSFILSQTCLMSHVRHFWPVVGCGLEKHRTEDHGLKRHTMRFCSTSAYSLVVLWEHLRISWCSSRAQGSCCSVLISLWLRSSR